MILTWPCGFFVGKAQKLSEPLQSAKSLLTRPYNQLNRCEHAGPAHVGPSQFRRAEDGPRSGRGRGRWRLQVFSKCLRMDCHGLRNPSKRTERSLNFPKLWLQNFFGLPLSLFGLPIGTFWQKVPKNHNYSSFKFLMISELIFSRAEQWTLRLLELNYFVCRWIFFFCTGCAMLETHELRSGKSAGLKLVGIQVLVV